MVILEPLIWRRAHLGNAEGSGPRPRAPGSAPAGGAGRGSRAGGIRRARRTGTGPPPRATEAEGEGVGRRRQPGRRPPPSAEGRRGGGPGDTPRRAPPAGRPRGRRGRPSGTGGCRRGRRSGCGSGGRGPGAPAPPARLVNDEASAPADSSCQLGLVHLRAARDALAPGLVVQLLLGAPSRTASRTRPGGRRRCRVPSCGSSGETHRSELAPCSRYGRRSLRPRRRNGLARAGPA